LASEVARAALITGASRGIGRGAALALAEAGFDVVLAARAVEGIEETAAAARHHGVDAHPISADLSDMDECQELAAKSREALGALPDAFVHCAGVAANGPIGGLSLADWERSMRINVTSAFVLAGELVPTMAERGWGRIVTIASLYARFGVARTAAYTSSKHALLGLTRVLAAEFARRGVTANAIVPGFVDTEMVREQAGEIAAARQLTEDQVIERFLRNQPLGRMVTVEEVASLVTYLCSDAAAPVTGQAIDIDGGSFQA